MRSIALLPIAILVLTAWTNIVVELIKKILACNRRLVQILLLIVALTSTIAAAAAASQYYQIKMLWYNWGGVLVTGVLVCYAAIFGYDKLWNKFKENYTKAKEVLKDLKGNKPKDQ